ncbi:MAG TPA: Uma2 family endonuclease [Flavisolibacter sp.]|jgi:Uma2 family endonuclease|nr:Uma2 family endonuclease [Flavisolibacter sp.]
MGNGIRKDTSSTPLTVAEYIQMELQSEKRHEFISGELIEMPGEKDINNQIAIFICTFLVQHLMPKGFQVYINDVKVAIPDRTKYFYPDVFATKELRTGENQYIKYEPELIVEVISPSTHITDTVDKYIAYTSIPSLKYYLIVEPETVYTTLFSKNAEGKWEAMSYVRNTDVLLLPQLDIVLPLNEVYKLND